MGNLMQYFTFEKPVNIRNVKKKGQQMLLLFVINNYSKL